MDLKQILESGNWQQLAPSELKALLTQMLHYIGDPDPHLRDKLIYSTFHQILTSTTLETEYYHWIFNECLEKLYFGLEENPPLSIFTRSFSSLILAILVQLEILTEQEYEAVFYKTLAYFEKEQDVRGFVEGNGWAHSIAHGADLLTTLVNHPNFPLKEHPKVLDAIASCLERNHIYADGEDGRLISAIEALLKKDLSETKLRNWIATVLIELQEKFQHEGFSNHFYRQQANTLNLLKTLYFRLSYNFPKSELPKFILAKLKGLI